MKISIRTVLFIMSTAAVVFGFYSPLLRTSHFDSLESKVFIFFFLILLILMFALFCATGASIAYDQVPTRRSAERGALKGFYVWVTLGILIGLIGLPRVT
ncbi:hypothetical protein CA13_10860 [Planctomycetes bacterium CA13]|uniref:Uncharacterized protein n=1 Tax=Novipirellula herctigrandis TaxID=2527986 RepID=A0A5C5YXS0_9BACT|nr:hypothetical protein CA13_10860 [Planctomycetes bacterium CA13]